MQFTAFYIHTDVMLSFNMNVKTENEKRIPTMEVQGEPFKTTNRAVAVLSKDNHVFLNFNTAYWLQPLDLHEFRYAPCAHSHQTNIEAEVLPLLKQNHEAIMASWFWDF